MQVGVRFDEPVGKGDGTAKGVTLFDCPMGYGGFVRGKNVKVGDYPERDIEDEDEDADHSAPKDDEDEL
jgi:tubulin-specific chaperone B